MIYPALTAQTGDEFAMFTNGGRRLLIRGNSTSVPVNEAIAKSLAKRGYRWSGHTHPGGQSVLRSSPGDRFILKSMWGNRSAIYNSLGQRTAFGQAGDLLINYLPH